MATCPSTSAIASVSAAPFCESRVRRSACAEALAADGQIGGLAAAVGPVRSAAAGTAEPDRRPASRRGDRPRPGLDPQARPPLRGRPEPPGVGAVRTVPQRGSAPWAVDQKMVSSSSPAPAARRGGLRREPGPEARARAARRFRPTPPRRARRRGPGRACVRCGAVRLQARRQREHAIMRSRSSTRARRRTARCEPVRFRYPVIPTRHAEQPPVYGEAAAIAGLPICAGDETASSARPSPVVASTRRPPLAMRGKRARERRARRGCARRPGARGCGHESRGRAGRARRFETAAAAVGAPFDGDGGQAEAGSPRRAPEPRTDEPPHAPSPPPAPPRTSAPIRLRRATATPRRWRQNAAPGRSAPRARAPNPGGAEGSRNQGLVVEESLPERDAGDLARPSRAERSSPPASDEARRRRGERAK